MVYRLNTLLLPLAACAVVQSVSTTAHLQKIAPIKTGVTWSLTAWGGHDNEDGHVIDVDMFGSSAEKIAQLKSDGHYVLCYIDVGTAESWRPDYDKLVPFTVGDSQYEDEKWLDLEQWVLYSSLMYDRFKLAKDKGCDGIETDNTDAYSNPLAMKGKTKEEMAPHQIAYLEWLSNAAHGLGLSIGLKNSMSILKDVHQWFEYALNESCNEFDECKVYKPFQDAGKAIFAVEYKHEHCHEAAKYGMTQKYVEHGHLVNC